MNLSEKVHLAKRSNGVTTKHLMRTSKAKFEFRKIAHLIERSEMMVLPQVETTSDIPLERMKDVEVRIFKSHLQRSSLHDVP